MPNVTSRTEAQLVLTLKANNTQVFRDVKEVSILNPLRSTTKTTVSPLLNQRPRPNGHSSKL
jgi:hypothetical protein